LEDVDLYEVQEDTLDEEGNARDCHRYQTQDHQELHVVKLHPDHLDH